MRYAQKIQDGKPGLCWKVILLDTTGKIYYNPITWCWTHEQAEADKNRKIEKTCTSSVEIFRAFVSSQPFICLLYLIKAANCPVQLGLLNIFQTNLVQSMQCYYYVLYMLESN